MVYNGTSSGPNNVLWGSHFALPMVNSMLITIERLAYMEGHDIGEMFLNFLLSKDGVQPKTSPFSGRDLV